MSTINKVLCYHTQTIGKSLGYGYWFSYFPLPTISLKKLHCRALEINKSLSLKKYAGNFVKTVQSKVEPTEGLDWWLREMAIVKRKTISPDTDFIIHTDVSDSGWGVTDGTKNQSGGNSMESETSFML